MDTSSINEGKRLIHSHRVQVTVLMAASGGFDASCRWDRGGLAGSLLQILCGDGQGGEVNNQVQLSKFLSVVHMVAER